MEAKIQRKWAFILGVLFILSEVLTVMRGEALFDFPNNYNTGNSLGKVGFSLFFFYLA